MSKTANLVATRYMLREALSVGNGFENELWRIHRYSNSIVVTDLTNAGKRGKKVDSWVIMGKGIRGDESLPMESMAMQYMMWAKRNANPSKMKSVIDEDLEVHGDLMVVEQRSERGVDVTPGGFKPLLVRGAHVTIESDYQGFSIKDINDDANEPTCIAKGKKSVKQFYRWCSDNAKKIQSWTLSQIMNELSKEGIEYHYFCAMD